MIFVYICGTFQWIFLISTQISAQNTSWNRSDNDRSVKLRRQWPDIKFEDLDLMSGDGPIDNLFDNFTETYVWTTIITQIKATVWPTVTRSRVPLTPKPKKIGVSSTPIISCHKYWSQVSYELAIEDNSEDLLDSILRRSSIVYPGPSSTIALSSIIPPSDISLSSYRSPVLSISKSMESYFSTKLVVPVVPFDRLTQHFSTKDYILSSGPKINSNSYSIGSIESSLTFPSIETDRSIERTPILWPTLTIESDKNSISGSLLSFAIPRKEDNVSSDIPFITSIDSSFRLISVSTTPSIQTMSQSLNNTIDSWKSSPVTFIAPTPSLNLSPSNILTTTPSPVPLCPESLQTQSPRESLDRPFEDYLIRTVLNKTSNESIEDIRHRIQRNIKQIYVFALKKSHNITDQMTGRTRITRNLLSKINYTDIDNIEVKLYDVIQSQGSDEIHVIYYVERDGVRIPYEDAFKILSHISDDKFSEIIGLAVIEKVKPYNEVKLSQSGLNLWPIILISISGSILIICIIAVVLVLCKYRSERRKWIDAFHSELNRVVPDNQIHWRTVSKPMDPNSGTVSVETNDRPKAYDNRNEFQYLGFKSDVKQQNETKTKTQSKGTQMESSLEMQKQKLIPIGKLIDESTDTTDVNGSDANEYIKTHFVTTKEIETKTNDNIPRVMSVQMSEQTESIIKAIRSELNRFGHSSNAFPFIDDTQPEDQSIISNSSEA